MLTQRATLLAMLARGCFLPAAREHALNLLRIDDARRARSLPFTR